MELEFTNYKLDNQGFTFIVHNTIVQGGNIKSDTMLLAVSKDQIQFPQFVHANIPI